MHSRLSRADLPILVVGRGRPGGTRTHKLLILSQTDVPILLQAVSPTSRFARARPRTEKQLVLGELGMPIPVTRAPSGVGIEPTISRLTGACCTTQLPGNMWWRSRESNSNVWFAGPALSR